MARAPLLIFPALCFVAFAGGANAAERKMVGVYKLEKGDFSVKVTNWGATIMSVVLPDSKGLVLCVFHSFLPPNNPWKLVL